MTQLARTTPQWGHSSENVHALLMKSAVTIVIALYAVRVGEAVTLIPWSVLVAQ